MVTPLLLSAYDLPLTATYPCLNLTSSFYRVLEQSVPSSIKSTLVSTPRVLSPFGSNYEAIFRASEFAESMLAGTTHKITVS